jgi:hypothetical protein
MVDYRIVARESTGFMESPDESPVAPAASFRHSS